MTRLTPAHCFGFISALLFTGWVLRPPSPSPIPELPSHEARAVANLAAYPIEP